jgi:hypothetical protein
LLCAVLAGGSAVGTRAALAGPEEDYYRAYYLQHESGNLEQALKLYESVARARGVGAELAENAALQARSCREDLRSRNFANLMPPQALGYLELRAPGEHLVRLLEQLGLTRDDSWKLPGQVKKQMQKYAVSPALLGELSSFKGLAVAVTGFDPVKRMPSFVAVLHPGDNEVLRGALETAIPAAGEPVNPLRGTRLFKIQDVYVAMTPRLVVVSQLRTEVDQVLKRLAGAGTPSLADDKEFASLQGDARDRMLFACFNAKEAMPFIQNMMQVAGSASQEFAMASALLDLDSLRWVALRAGVTDEGLSETLLVRFDEDQNNLVYNFLRTPPLTRSSLACVPPGAAGFVAVSLSEPVDSRGAKKVDRAETVRRITGLDLGREIFANIEEKALYVLSPGESPEPGTADFTMPDVGVVLTVRDPSRSEALWTQLLSLPTLATGQPAPQGRDIIIAGTKAKVYEWPEGIKAYYAAVDNHILIAMTERAITESLRAARGGGSVLQDEAFSPSLARLGASSSKALFIHAGRCVRVARAVSGEELAEIAPFEHLLDELVASVWTDESNSEFRLTAAVTGIPEIGGTIEQLVRGQLCNQADSGGELAAAESAGRKRGRMSRSQCGNAKRRVHAAAKSATGPRPPKPPNPPVSPGAPSLSALPVPAPPAPPIPPAQEGQAVRKREHDGRETDADGVRRLRPEWIPLWR